MVLMAVKRVNVELTKCSPNECHLEQGQPKLGVCSLQLNVLLLKDYLSKDRRMTC